jgi:hypothetical protein
MDEVVRVFSDAEGDKYTGYGRFPIPSPSDWEVQQVIQIVTTSSAETRDCVMSLVGNSQAFVAREPPHPSTEVQDVGAAKADSDSVGGVGCHSDLQ